MYQQIMEELELFIAPETSSLLTRVVRFLTKEGIKLADKGGEGLKEEGEGY